MEAKHTPGPWMAASGPSSIVGWPVVGRQGRSICNVSWLGHRPSTVSDGDWTAYYEETQANANLIAAAPDLLEALTKLQGLMTHFREATSGNQADAYYTFVKGEDATWREVDAAIAKATGAAQ